MSPQPRNQKLMDESPQKLLSPLSSVRISANAQEVSPTTPSKVYKYLKPRMVKKYQIMPKTRFSMSRKVSEKAQTAEVSQYSHRIKPSMTTKEDLFSNLQEDTEDMISHPDIGK